MTKNFFFKVSLCAFSNFFTYKSVNSLGTGVMSTKTGCELIVQNPSGDVRAEETFREVIYVLGGGDFPTRDVVLLFQVQPSL